MFAWYFLFCLFTCNPGLRIENGSLRREKHSSLSSLRILSLYRFHQYTRHF
jgi:hypothetical protein